METVTVKGKRKKSRGFSLKRLKRETIRRKLRVENCDIDQVLAKLQRDGYIGPVASGFVKTTQVGNDLKHPFWDLRNELIGNGTYPAEEARTVRFVVVLKAEMKERFG